VTKKYGGEELPLEKKYDPEVNAHYAALYLKELVGKTHSYKKALAAYGEGSAFAEKVLVKQTEIKNYYREKKKKEGQSSVISQYVETGSPEIDKAIANKQLKSFVKMMTYGDIPYAKIYEEDIDKALYDFMEQEFPLTDEAKKAIRDKMVMNVTGLYDPERGGFYDEALKENPYAQRSEGGLYGFTTIQNQPNVLTAMHEALHSYIMEKGNIRSEKWVDEFNKAWEQAKKNPDLKKTMDSIDYTLKTNPRYKYTTKKDKDRKANERFAYLGSELGGGGLNMLPKELREYYSDVFKQTRTTKQIKLADRLGKQYDKIIDQVADEKISREEASRKLNKIDRRLSYYFKDFQKREGYAGILKKYISK